MSDPMAAVESIGRQKGVGLWTWRLVWFLRAMAAFSLLKGLYHWAVVVGFGEQASSVFETSSTAWQGATIFFAGIDLVAAGGLWLVGGWGGAGGGAPAALPASAGAGSAPLSRGGLVGSGWWRAW